CKSLGTGARPVVTMLTKAPGGHQQIVTEFAEVETGPLIAQDSVYVRYDVQLNKPAFDYIVAANLYSVAGQKAAKSVNFPTGGTTVGAMVIKTAWKVFPTNVTSAATARFHVMQAWVYTDSSEGLPAQCAQRTL